MRFLFSQSLVLDAENWLQCTFEHTYRETASE
jgi:hypothetical protein